MPPLKKDLSSSRCVVPGCTSVCLQVGSHCFPKDLELSKAWVEAVRNPMLWDIDSSILNKNYHVCKLHFSLKDYIPRTTKARLRKNIVPSLRLSADVDKNVTTSATVVTDEQCAVSSSGTDASSASLVEPSTSGPPAKKARTRIVSRVTHPSSR
ncbi:uncharacterized protein LOC107270510 isoform X2 [Cephus cinctus]|uniref:Uncharacterized protein LOC107270510 isoform X2 n=1 Tax=Cephus cinctus TaxID=211228 RepID=A0AAJ7C3I8_CEPCN|nr:uncharacterized protein LOC107270510 isoform X2 [Cephus cinctus]